MVVPAGLQQRQHPGGGQFPDRLSLPRPDNMEVRRGGGGQQD